MQPSPCREAVDNKVFSEIRWHKYGSRSQASFQFLKTVLTLWGPLKVFIFLEKFREGFGYFGEVFNEAATITG